jgi:hypothetical protein
MRFPLTWMVSAPIMKMAPRAKGKAIDLFRRRNQAQEPDRHTPTMTHQDGGRHAYLPAQSPAANASAAQRRGCRAEICFPELLAKLNYQQAVCA